ncbi:MAG: hypothetical protein A2X83_00930 [Desulfuromonadales bacterium GWD2_54_10]|nr:MAG: hypothetical protein A2X83_00930 [Desulfuromonadales bacterium GWD2_54_10]
MQQIPGEILDAIESIQMPPMPQVLLRFLSVVDDEHASMAELATLVGQDPALCARVLTISNSPALRRGAEVKCLDQCLVVLGTRLMRTLAACLAIQSVFARTSGDLRYNLAGFWGHSLRVAEIARAIATHVNYSDIEEAYLAGLLHDIGQLLLLGGMSERYGVLLDWSSDESALHGIEEPLLGTGHAAVGSWLVDQWKLSSFMADAVLFHHKPANEIAHADFLSQIVWSAHIIDKNKSTDFSQSKSNSDIAAIKSILGIEPADASAILQLCTERVTLLATALEIAESEVSKTLPCSSTPIECFKSKPSDNDLAYSRMEAVVRDMAMMHSLQQRLTELYSESEILLAVRESGRILFGIGRLAFLLVQPDKQILSGPDICGQPDLLQQIEITLDSEHSLAAAAVLRKQPLSTFDEQRSTAASLVDTQIARALGCEGVLYVPMCARENQTGVMVYGLNAAQYARIHTRLDWMTSFANLAASSLETWRELRGREQKLETTLNSRFERHVRRAVHEAGNPLAIIKNYLKIVSRKLPDDSDVQQELNILREEIDRVTHIVRQLSDLTEISTVADTFEINAVIEGMLTLYGESLFSGCNITLEKSLDPNLGPMTGDRDSLKQILFNLWKNGSEAMPAGGSFTISTHGNVIQGDKSFTEIRLSDSGPGLPPEVLQCLFKPLDPNRRPGHSGIGLSIVASLVERLGGQITCQSLAGKGTDFIISLPQSKVG